MNIAAIPSHAHAAPALGRPTKADATPATTPTAPSAEPLDDARTEADRTPGVLRLLAEGHFNGVAELRHRIHYHERLAAEANQAAAQTLADGADDLVGAVRDGVDALSAALSATDETTSTPDGGADPSPTASLLGAFADSVASAVSAGDGGTVDLSGVEDGLRASFDALVGGLRDLYQPSQDETDVANDVTTEETEPADGTGGTSAFDDALAALTSAFEDALASLLDAATEAGSLPAVGSALAPGKGQAYDKFLAIYNELRGATERTSESVIDAAA